MPATTSETGSAMSRLLQPCTQNVSKSRLVGFFTVLSLVTLFTCVTYYGDGNGIVKFVPDPKAQGARLIGAPSSLDSSSLPKSKDKKNNEGVVSKIISSLSETNDHLKQKGESVLSWLATSSSLSTISSLYNKSSPESYVNTPFTEDRFHDIAPLYQQKRVNCSALFSGENESVDFAVALAKSLAAEEAKRTGKNIKKYKNIVEKDKLASNLTENVRAWMKEGEFEKLTNQYYINATQNCDLFKQTRGYITSSLSDEEAEFPIAFSLLVFKDIEMVERMFRSVYRPQNRYCIHVDLKSGGEFYKAVKAIADCFQDSVVMSSRRVDVRWGTWTVLEPELICMQDLWGSPEDLARVERSDFEKTGDSQQTLLSRGATKNKTLEGFSTGDANLKPLVLSNSSSNSKMDKNVTLSSSEFRVNNNSTALNKARTSKNTNETEDEKRLRMKKEFYRTKWKYFINLTGQEFTLKTNHELVKILKAYKGANNEEGTRKRANKDRWKTPAPLGIKPAKGGVHTLLNRATIDYLLHNDTAQQLLKWLKTTGIPDETLFATINYNPQLGIPGTYNGTEQTMENIPYLTRYKMWYGANCESKQTVRGICIFASGDLPRLGEAPHLFANKFYLHEDRIVIGCLEEKNFNNTRDEFLGRKHFNTTFYENQDFVINRLRGNYFGTE